MTEKEKKEILELIDSHLNGKLPEKREETFSAFAPTRSKWFRDVHGTGYKSMMNEVIGNAKDSWVVWESIRKITCKIMGVAYVRQLRDVDTANRIADKICQCVYDCAKELKDENCNYK